MAIGWPVFFAMAIAGLLVYLLYPNVMPDFIFAQSFVNGLDSYSFAAIPFFFLAGAIMNAGGMSRRLLNFAHALVGHIRGGLGHVNVVANVGMAGVSGSAVADAAAIGSILVPAMKQQGYSGGYAAAVTAAAATIGPIIPPSIPFVLFGLLTQVSVGKLFIAGIVPGFLMGIALFATTWWIGRRRSYPAEPFRGWRHVWATGRDGLLALGMPAIIVFAKVGGLATTTEFGAVAVMYAAAVSLFVYRELTVRGLWLAVRQAAIEAISVLLIASVAGIFVWITARFGLGRALSSWISGITTDPKVTLFIVAALILALGTVLEPVIILLVLVPILVPVAIGAHIDLVHFGVVVVMATTIGLILPPIGFLIYLCGRQAQVSVVEVVRELRPFLVALIFVLMTVVFVPEVSTFLPQLTE
ncbi:MAG: TRAP transporter large permease [Ferrovibrio sp.]|uniref:TRAP transporter large permease n=1 Tax=Ferrovibrio sp. TaxID=1917215 RepID=UPI0026252903|nr:TRAP transporter large permease [Ferrovibrio sp.]MCW0232581.1 TRAP transporter large permease [Ferrovibrio sp.]